MKNVLQKITCLMIAFMVVGCGQAPSSDKAPESQASTSVAPSSQSEQTPTSSTSPTSSEQAPSSAATSQHEHLWASAYEYDETNHWHKCRYSNCTEVNDLEPHDFSEPAEVNPGSLSGADKYAYAIPKAKTCKKCGYTVLTEGTNLLPELHFDFKETNTAGDPQEVEFMNIAKKNDIKRPEVEGTYTLTNCPVSSMNFSKVPGTMKVRGNQTAGWAKKGFRIKFDKKRNVLGLNNGGKWKKWVLLADAKDTCLIRTDLGLYISRQVCQDEDQIWVCDCTPVTVYLNGEYWGYYYLAEQKEVKPDDTGIQRVRLPEAEGDSVEIGYCFELDHYADAAGSNDDSSEIAKGVDGDPTFRMRYIPEIKQGSPSGPLATGKVYTYTMLSDITDGPSDVHVQADYSKVENGGWNNAGAPSNGATKTSNSAQLSFIRDRMELLYQVLYNAAINNAAKEISDSGEIVSSTKTVEEVIRQYFDVASWVDCSIIMAVVIPPDLGYSSFYMSYDNTPTGDHKLRFDCPWDFDSNFGNRNNFYVDGKTDTYVENTFNTWIYLFNKIAFFKNAVKAKWNALRDAQVFEGAISMIKERFTVYDAEIHRNHYKWPQNDAAHQPPNNFDEIRNPYKDPAQYKEAEAETIKWLANRINYLETKWGSGHTNISTTA